MFNRLKIIELKNSADGFETDIISIGKSLSLAICWIDDILYI